jgi:3-hydroxyacyl-[acyl-carrier-protein] dehydratase
MLQDSFYKVVKFSPSGGTIHALLSLNRDHNILKGHFPGQPVVPGVCMMQMIKELVAYHLKRDLRLANADNMKFLSVLNPDKICDVEANISYHVENEMISLNASLFSGSVTFFKLKATLVSAG